MCSDCLKDQHIRSSTFFYCHLCKSKETSERSLVLCQPVTDICEITRQSVQGNDSIEIQDLSTVRVELFPINQTVTGNEKLHEDEIATLDPEVALMNEDLILTQTHNQNGQRIITTDCQVLGINENNPLAQRVVQTENDTDICSTLYIPDWFIEIMTSDKHVNRIHCDISKRCWLTDELQEEIRSYYPSSNGIQVNEVMGNCVRDLEAFMRNCG